MFRVTFIILLYISTLTGQVNIEGLRNSELDRTNFSVEIDSDFATQSNKDNWEIFDEAQTKAIEVGKEIGQSVQFYVPLHRGFKTGLYNQDLNQLKLINNV